MLLCRDTNIQKIFEYTYNMMKQGMKNDPIAENTT